jgi:hypothetical protein
VPPPPQQQPEQTPAGEPPSTVAAIAQGAVATAEQVRGRAEEVAGTAAAQAGAVAHATTERVDLDRVAGLWPAVLDHMRQSGAGLLSAAIGAARPVSVDADSAVLEVAFPPSAAFNRRKAEVKENRDRVVDAVRAVVGTTLRPVYVTLEEEADAVPAQASPTPAGPEADDDLYERFVSEFDAEVVIDDEPERREETS